MRPILRMLEQSKWISATELGRSLGYKKGEVEKGIEILKQRGASVECDTAGGYRLTDRITLIDERRLAKFLDHAALVTAARLMVLDTVESTNNQLLQWMDRETLHGRACVAEYQSRGRGRYGRSWHAAPYCNIAVSLAWKTRSDLAALPVVSLVAGLAVARVLERAGLAGVQLKWPNDLVSDQGKLGGILVEVKSNRDSISGIVIGVGINLQNPTVFSERAGQPVANLQDLMDKPVDRTQLIGELLVELSSALDKLERCGFTDDATEWNRRDACFGLEVIGHFGDRQIRGEGLGIDRSGAYCVRDSAGRTHRLISGEVTMLRVRSVALVGETDPEDGVYCTRPARLV